MNQQDINSTSMLKVGTILRGTYRIDSYLSSGGFGNTYVATNIEFEERVAIKEFFMKGVTQRDENQTTVSVSNTENQNRFLEQKEKFKKEARRIRQLKSEHIVSVHDLFEENGTAYYVMDYVDGENLAERLTRTGKPMTEREVREILPQILDTLKSVHNAGIWHLDLKPANIMVDKAGNVKIIDFGASKQLNVQKGGATTSTAISYTNGYAPREQMEQNYDKFGPWTDLYALGATLYTLLSNKRPPLPTDIDDDISEDKHLALPLPPDAVNSILHELILWMMSTNRNRRPQNVDSIVTKIKESNSDSKENLDEETILAKNDDEETIISTNRKSLEKKDVEEFNKDDYRKEFGAGNAKDKYKKWFYIGIPVLIIVFVILITANSLNSLDVYEAPIEIKQKEETKILQNFDVKSPLGDYKYTGPVDSLLRPNGVGEASFTDGRIYKGGFVEGNLSGRDSYFKYPNGDEFKGEFKDNAFYRGTYTIAEDGSYFTGTFKKGQPDTGTWYNKDGKMIE